MFSMLSGDYHLPFLCRDVIGFMSSDHVVNKTSMKKQSWAIRHTA